ncbi:MAG: Gfo/Idh/MocA family oxidoreductase [Polyangiaceae bacterium]
MARGELNQSVRGRARVALVGAGAWGTRIQHTLLGLESVELCVVCDPSAAARDSAVALAPRVRVVSELSEVLARGDLDAVFIATPPSTHAALALECLDAGLDVFVEKPMALGLREACALEAMAERRQRLLMVGHILEYHPAVVALGELVQGGSLGEIQILISERLGPSARRHEDAWWSLGPHDVSVLRKLVGEPCRASVRGWPSDRAPGAEVALGRIDLDGGGAALVHLSLVNRAKVRRIVLVGSSAVAVFDDLCPSEELRIFERSAVGEGRLADIVGNARGLLPRDRPEHDALDGVAPAKWLPVQGQRVIPVAMRAPLELEAEHFISGVLHRTPVRSDGASGRAVVATLEAGARSLSAGGAPEEVFSA